MNAILRDINDIFYFLLLCCTTFKIFRTTIFPKLLTSIRDKINFWVFIFAIKFELCIHDCKIPEDEEEGEIIVESARPRRMSDISIKQKKKPIPPGSAFFILSQTNRYAKSAAASSPGIVR